MSNLKDLKFLIYRKSAIAYHCRSANRASPENGTSRISGKRHIAHLRKTAHRASPENFTSRIFGNRASLEIGKSRTFRDRFQNFYFQGLQKAEFALKKRNSQFSKISKKRNSATKRKKLIPVIRKWINK